MAITTRILIEGVEYADIDDVTVEKCIADFNSSGNFNIHLDNDNGRNADKFSINDNVVIYATDDTGEHKIFNGLIEDISFTGTQNRRQKITLSGRDYSAFLHDIIAEPRIFKNTEVSKIVEALFIQNMLGTGLTFSNINPTTTTIQKITFNNLSMFDAIMELSSLSGFYFYVDEDKDFHFEERDAISSGVLLDNTNVLSTNIKNTDSDIYNHVTVYGDRQLTGVREFFSSPTTGSSYILDDKPHNVVVIGSPTFFIQPGGIVGVSDPSSTDVKYLVDYHSQLITFTSGATAGNNLGWLGSDIIIDYQRSSPIISIKTDKDSIAAYGKKHKKITDRNVKDLIEANEKCLTFLNDHKDLKNEGSISVDNLVNITPGHTCEVNLPFYNINSQEFTILKCEYSFNKINNLKGQVLRLDVNKKINSLTDYIKEHELRLRRLEGTEIDSSITNISLGSSFIGVSNTYTTISRSIGSAFYFHVPGHNQLNSPKSLLGYVTGGSVVKTS